MCRPGWNPSSSSEGISTDTVSMQVGRRIYEEFSMVTVVILGEQIGVSDEPR